MFSLSYPFRFIKKKVVLLCVSLPIWLQTAEQGTSINESSNVSHMFGEFLVKCEDQQLLNIQSLMAKTEHCRQADNPSSVLFQHIFILTVSS